MGHGLLISLHCWLHPEQLDGLDWAVAVKTVVGLLGGLALFLYGIEKMSEGLRTAAGERLKLALEKLTSNRWAGLLTGVAFTATIQSSSLTTVLVVSFVSAGLLSLQQSVPVIIGSNIGTSFTAQLVSFNVTSAAWILVALGFFARRLSSWTGRDTSVQPCWAWACCSWPSSRWRRPRFRCGNRHCLRTGCNAWKIRCWEL